MENPADLIQQRNRLAAIRQYAATFIMTLPMLMTGAATAWPSPVLAKVLGESATASDPFALDVTQASWVVSLMFLGNTISPVPVGWLMDRFGRKRTLQVLNAMPLSGWSLTYAAAGRPDAHRWLYAARTLNGLWAGAAYTVCAVYIGEVAEPKYRGSLSNFNNLLRSVGGLLVYAVGPYVSYEALAVWCGAVPALFFVAVAFVPESPYFLLMKGRRAEAGRALAWLRARPEVAVETELAKVANAVAAQTENEGSIADMFVDPATRKAMVITIGAAVVKNLSGFDVMMAYTSVTLPPAAFATVGFGPEQCVIVLGVVSVASCFFSFFLLDQFARKALLTVSSLGCALTTLLAGGWFFLDSDTDVDVADYARLPFYCFALHAVTYSVGLGPIVAVLKAEMFSAHVKGICSAVTSILFALLTFVFTKMYLLVANSVGMYVNYFVYTTGCALGTVFFLTYLVETRGKTLNEIQVKLSQKKRSVNENGHPKIEVTNHL